MTIEDPVYVASSFRHNRRRVGVWISILPRTQYKCKTGEHSANGPCNINSMYSRHTGKWLQTFWVCQADIKESGRFGVRPFSARRKTGLAAFFPAVDLSAIKMKIIRLFYGLYFWYLGFVENTLSDS